ncbi:molybdenum cofactor guanylyltransferase [Mesoterricola silvestris]|uniref:MobA-like NTP transferase domain-containing protein n=1 Tax=Mesoterricola silvestris TaxID=2927979 RepID=A0AA48KA87_9BACT|nr:NTP transferase domain-containing protein [Mesoterricola silvestris]BDU73057.1 hypothetical protein METEAL_22310 [Mesoterricola silvestris]
MKAGLLLLTGGQGRRFGGPKHAQPHPRGGTWGGHLVAVFQAVFPDGPLQILGEPLPDRPDLTPLADPGQGPAAALVRWASQATETPDHWWVVACDQVRWTPEALAAWHARVLEADPGAGHWVMAQVGDYTQYLGSFLPSSRVGDLAAQKPGSLRDLARALPTRRVEWPNPCWEDVDTPGALEAWLGQGPPPLT